MGSLRSSLFCVLERLGLMYSFFCWVGVLDIIRTASGEKEANNEDSDFAFLGSGI